ncbi:formate dehydrogenase subunit gamma [Rhodobacter sp. Har01]|uniref:formate dehydrogenase subunit gamma n=1 Tax=Rhodobacter sp. Har01 TaxID=2883999 RepID=UPI001D08E36A|nr:formate dehydrogenase subunit gamma [Rhodobacter sp. Har01]MCB6178075.1 formate dehydrogenase subunit gamma [Rhodobacter sp. Har01]
MPVEDDLSPHACHTLEAILRAHARAEGPLLPILHDVQAAFGHVPQAAVPVIAEALNLGRAEVHGVMSFYHDFRNAPAGRSVVKLCRAEACQAMGGESVSEQVQKALGVGFHETSADGMVTLEPVYCLGLCACAPAAMVNGRLEGRLDEAAVNRIAAEVLA